MNFFTDEIIRFRVVKEIFSETSPTSPQVTGEAEKSETKNTSPYTLWVCIIILIPFFPNIIKL